MTAGAWACPRCGGRGREGHVTGWHGDPRVVLRFDPCRLCGGTGIYETGGGDA